MTTTTKPEPASKRTRKTTLPSKASAHSKAARAADASPQATAVPKQATKSAQVEALLTRAAGASLDELCHATGWLPHTCRAFLTGLRKKGRTLDRSKREDDMTIYRFVSGAPVGAGEVRESAEATA